MKTNYLLTLIFLWVINFTSCSSDKENPMSDIWEFAGFYKIVSIVSTEFIDMNNDGIQTNDILSEMLSMHLFHGQPTPSFYNPDLFWAEVRPLAGHTSDMRLIEFNYPYQIIADENEGDPTLYGYTKKFVRYSYNLHSGNVIEVIDDYPEYNAQYGAVKSAVRLDEYTFKVEFLLRLFDFKEKRWIETDVVVKYSKVLDLSF